MADEDAAPAVTQRPAIPLLFAMGVPSRQVSASLNKTLELLAQQKSDPQNLSAAKYNAASGAALVEARKPKVALARHKAKTTVPAFHKSPSSPEHSERTIATQTDSITDGLSHAATALAVEQQQEVKQQPVSARSLTSFSLKVCEKVEQLKVTTYEKVVDDLVVELTGPGGLQFAGEKVRGPDFNLGLANAFLCRC